MYWLALWLDTHPSELLNMSPSFRKWVVCPLTTALTRAVPLQKQLQLWAIPSPNSLAHVAGDIGPLLRRTTANARKGPMRCTLNHGSYLQFSTPLLFQLGWPLSQPGRYSSKQGRGRQQIWPQLAFQEWYRQEMCSQVHTCAFGSIRTTVPLKCTPTSYSRQLTKVLWPTL